MGTVQRAPEHTERQSENRDVQWTSSVELNKPVMCVRASSHDSKCSIGEARTTVNHQTGRLWKKARKSSAAVSVLIIRIVLPVNKALSRFAVVGAASINLASYSVMQNKRDPGWHVAGVKITFFFNLKDVSSFELLNLEKHLSNCWIEFQYPRVYTLFQLLITFF